MRKDDWITKLYYKQLGDRQKHNNDTRENVSCKEKIPSKSIKFKRRRLD